jgi:hypothetical protein
MTSYLMVSGPAYQSRTKAASCGVAFSADKMTGKRRIAPTRLMLKWARSKSRPDRVSARSGFAIQQTGPGCFHPLLDRDR